MNKLEVNFFFALCSSMMGERTEREVEGKGYDGHTALCVVHTSKRSFLNVNNLLFCSMNVCTVARHGMYIGMSVGDIYMPCI